MKRITIVRLLFVAMLSLVVITAGACGGNSDTQNADSVGQVSQVHLQYAHGFALQNLQHGCKLVTDSAGAKFLLVPRGEKRPAGYSSLTVINTPVQRIVCLSSTFVSDLRPIGALNAVRGVPSGPWYIGEIKNGIADGQIEVVETGMGEPDYEKIIALKPDVVFTYTAAGPTSETIYTKLKSLGIPTVVDNDWLEQNPLGRMEWVKFMAAFVNKEDVATAFFEQAVTRVLSMEQKTSTQPNKPDVVWGMTMDGRTWYMDPGNGYSAEEVKMAGGKFAFANVTGSGMAQLSPEAVYAGAEKADVWIFASATNYFQGLKNLVASAPWLAKTKPFKTGNIWVFQPWYWQSNDRTDGIIADLAAIFYPGLFPHHRMLYFVKAK